MWLKRARDCLLHRCTYTHVHVHTDMLSLYLDKNALGMLKIQDFTTEERKKTLTRFSPQALLQQ